MADKRIFVDGVESISMVEGMIHLELFNYIPGPKPENSGTPREKGSELIMPPQGFLRAFAAMEQLVQQLADAGVISRSKPQAAASAPDESRKAPESPNFN